MTDLDKIKTKSPAELSFSDLTQLASGIVLSDRAAQARDMFEGRHLGKTKNSLEYWAGPLISTEGLTGDELAAVDRVRSEMRTAIINSFVSTNFVKTVVRRQTRVVLGRAPTWTTKDNQADVLLKTIWDTNKLFSTLRKAAWQALTEDGRAALRFRFPKGLLEQDPQSKVYTVRRGATAEIIASNIRIEKVSPEAITLYENPDTLEPVSLYSYSLGTGGVQAFELSWVDFKSGRTIIKIWEQGREPVEQQIDLAGKLLHHVLELEPIITEQVLANQRAYNFNSTMINRNTELAGFLERYGINIEPPSKMVNGVKTFIKPKFGGGTMNFWVGQQEQRVDQMGNVVESVMPGTYNRFDPSPPDAMEAAAKHNKFNIHDEVGQTFVLMNSDATASGESRSVSMEDFKGMAEDMAQSIDLFGQQLLETALALIGHFSNASLKTSISFASRVRVETLKGQERVEYRNDVEKGYISRERYQWLVGVDEPGLEDEKILEERGSEVVKAFEVEPISQPPTTPNNAVLPTS